MITSDQEERLVKLEAYVVAATGKSPAQFWRGFEELSVELEKDAFANNADCELVERYTSLLANADEAGFVVPLKAMGVLEEGD